MKPIRFSTTIIAVLLIALGAIPSFSQTKRSESWIEMKKNHFPSGMQLERNLAPYSNAVQNDLRLNTEFNYQGLVGPGYGHVYSIAYSPDQEGVIYLANWQNQIMRSTDNGATWNHFYSAPNEPRGWVICGSLKFANPNEPNHLYVSVSDFWDTQDQNEADVDTRGIYIIDVTTSEVVKIIQVFDIQHLKFRDYAVDPDNPDNIVLFASMGVWYAGSQQTIWRTTDGGETIEKIYDYTEHGRIGIWTVNIHPENPEIILVGLAGAPEESPDRGGFKRSTDGGQTWTYLKEQILVQGLNWNSSNPDLIVAVGRGDGNSNIMKRSVDAGLSWENIDSFSVYHGSDTPNYFVDVFSFPQDPSTIWAITLLEVLKSDDAGLTWQTDFLYNDEEFFFWGAHDIILDPFDYNHLIVATDYRVVESFDKGENWSAMEIPTMNLYGIHATTYPDGQQFLHYQSTGSYFSHNLQTGEIRDSLALEWFINSEKYIYPDKYTKNRVFVASKGNLGMGINVFVNDDNFETGLQKIYSDNQASFLKDIFRAPEQEETYFMLTSWGEWDGESILHRTTNNFTSVHELSVTGSDLEVIWCVEAVEGQPGVLWAFAGEAYYDNEGYLIIDDHGIFKSEDYGDSWTKSSEGIPTGKAVWNISVNPFNANNLIASVNGDGIYITNDGGETWMKTNCEINVYEIFYSQKHENIILARQMPSQGASIVYSADGGRSWYLLPKDVVKDVNTSGMAIIDQEGSIDIYIGTWGHNIIKYNLELQYSLTLNVDMTNAEGFNPEQHSVYVSGTFGEMDWVEPGQNDQLILQRVDETMTYTITLDLQPGEVEYKYYSDAAGSGWDGGEWEAGENRTVSLNGDKVINDVWGNPAANVSDELLPEAINIYPNPASSIINVDSKTDILKIEIINMLGNIVCSIEPASTNTQISVADYKSGLYFIRIHTINGSSLEKFIVRK